MENTKALLTSLHSLSQIWTKYLLLQGTGSGQASLKCWLHMSFSFMLSSNKGNRFYTKYTISTTGLDFFPVPVSIIKHTLTGRLAWSDVHIESGKEKTFYLKLQEILNFLMQKKQKVPISISLCITWKFRLSKHGHCVMILHKFRSL